MRFAHTHLRVNLNKASTLMNMINNKPNTNMVVVTGTPAEEAKL